MRPIQFAQLHLQMASLFSILSHSVFLFGYRLDLDRGGAGRGGMFLFIYLLGNLQIPHSTMIQVHCNPLN